MEAEKKSSLKILYFQAKKKDVHPQHLVLKQISCKQLGHKVAKKHVLDLSKSLAVPYWKEEAVAEAVPAVKRIKISKTLSK